MRALAASRCAVSSRRVGFLRRIPFLLGPALDQPAPALRGMPPPRRSSGRRRQGLPLRVRREIKAAPDTAGARGRRQAFFTAEQHHHRARFPLAQASGLFAMPLSLSQPQFLAIANAAAALYPGDRDPFIAAVAAALEGVPIGDGIVGRIIRDVQCRFDHPEPEQVPARWERDEPGFQRVSKRAF
jgi:hypothetical protein